MSVRVKIWVGVGVRESANNRVVMFMYGILSIPVICMYIFSHGPVCVFMHDQ